MHKIQGREREACAQNTGERYLLMHVTKGADSIWFFFSFFNQRPAEDEESAEKAGCVCCVSLSIVSSFAFILCHIIIHTMSHHHTYYVSLSIVYCCVSLSILSHTIHRENAHNTQEENTGQRDRIRLCCLIVCSVALPCIFLMCVMCNSLMYGMCIFLPSTRRVLKRQGTSVLVL